MLLRHFTDGPQRENVTDRGKALLAVDFEEHRPDLRAVAYRRLESLTEANDAIHL